MSFSYYFAIVSRNNNLLYETHFTNVKELRDSHPPVFFKQLVAHAVLDVVDTMQWHTRNMFLKCIDKYERWYISVMVTASLTRFVIVHDVINEHGIKNFFFDVLELYIKYTMNPFYEDGTKIKSERFVEKVRIYGRRYLCD